MKTAVFGKMNAQYAFEPRSNDDTQHYGSTDGNLNFFREKSKTTLRFAANNMNGNSQSKMAYGGLNYINAWGEQDRIKLEGSYGYNTNNNKHYSWLERDYFLTEEEIASGSDEIYEHYESNSRSHSKGSGHNFNVRFEDRISQRQRLMVRAQLSFSGNDSDGSSSNEYYPISGIDHITSRTGTWATTTRSTRASTATTSRVWAKRRAAPYTSTSAPTTRPTIRAARTTRKKAVDNFIRQRSSADNYNYHLNGGITYAEPIGKQAQVTIGYNVG